MKATTTIITFLAVICATQGQLFSRPWPSVLPQFQNGLNQIGALQNPLGQMVNMFENLLSAAQTNLPARVQSIFNQVAGIINNLENDLQAAANVANEANHDDANHVDVNHVDVNHVDANHHEDLTAALECAEAYLGDVHALSDRFTQRVEEIKSYIDKGVEEQIGPLAQLARDQLDRVSIVLQEAPYRIQEAINNGDAIAAGNNFQMARDAVYNEIAVILKAYNEARDEIPEFADIANNLAEEFHHQTYREAERIKNSVEECVASGGPQYQEY